MRKTKKRFLSALLACAMMISLFPFAAFADDTTVNNINDLQSAIKSADDGDTITLAAGTYDLTTSPLVIEKRVNLVGAGADQTTITGQIVYKFSEDQSGNTLTISNLTIKPNGADLEGLLFRGNEPNSGYNLNIIVENCSFDNWQFGIAMHSHANGYNLTVKNCRFPSTLCAVNYNYDVETSGQVANNSVTFEGSNIVDEGLYAVQKYNNKTEELLSNKYFATIEDYINGNAVEQNPTLVSNAVAKVGNTFYSDLQSAVIAASTPGDIITLVKDLTSDQKIMLNAGVTLDGNGHSLTYTGGNEESPTSGAFITAEVKNNVTIKNITINANNIKHGVQFYCCEGGTLENAVVNGGTFTSVIVNGATDVTIADSDLNPSAGAYTNLEYAMGNSVSTVPSMSINNVSFSGSTPAVWVDYDTVAAMKKAMDKNNNGANITDEQIQKELLKQVTYTNNNGSNLALSVEFVDKQPATPVYVESTYQPPYTGKYSYAINVADTDNGSVSVDKYATEGEKVTLTVSPDKAYKLDALTVTAGGKDVELTDNGDGTYTFTMPSSNVKVSASFVEDNDYVEPDNSITVSMTIGSNDFVINNNIVTVPDAAPYIANDRTYVPFRALGEALGAKVVWDNDARTVTYTLGDTEIVMTIGDTTYTINGVEKNMDVAPEITGDRTYVPVRFVAEGLGFKVTPLYADNGTTASVVFEK